MLKPHWETEELVENWTLLPNELELVNNKVGANQIGFAVLLKYFELMARFPDDSAEIRKLFGFRTASISDSEEISKRSLTPKESSNKLSIP